MTNGNGAFKAPRHLRPPTRRWCEQIDRDYELGSHHHRLLILAATAWDRAEEARIEIGKHGLVFDGKFGPKPRPEVAIEDKARIAFARLVRELGLDVNDPDDARPPRGKV